MKFTITRTSMGSKQKPCDEAYQGSYTIVDERPIDDPAKLHYPPDRDDWYARGTNHRVENGHIMRDLTASGYLIDIATLEDLMAFVAKYDTCIIGNGSYPSIEIYDERRE